MRTARAQLRTWAGGLLILALAAMLAGCGGSSTTATAFNMPPRPTAGANALEPFYVVTSDYSELYTSSTQPFNLADQFSSAQYPLPLAYQTTVTEPDNFVLPRETELAIQTWAQADPRISVLSGVPLGEERVEVKLVDSISYAGMTNIIGLTRLIKGAPDPYYEVSVVTIDPTTGLPMPNTDITKTLTHELGHVFGLGHSPDDRDLMYYRASSQQGRTRQTFLTLGDALALWTTLNRRQVTWYPQRQAVIPAGRSYATLSASGEAVTRVADTDAVVCVYTRD